MPWIKFIKPITLKNIKGKEEKYAKNDKANLSASLCKILKTRGFAKNYKAPKEVKEALPEEVDISPNTAKTDGEDKMNITR